MDSGPSISKEDVNADEQTLKNTDIQPQAQEVEEQEEPSSEDSSGSEISYEEMMDLLEKEKKKLEKNMMKAMKKGKSAQAEEILRMVEAKRSSIALLAQQITPTTTNERSSRPSKVPDGLPSWNANHRATKTTCIHYLDSLQDAFMADQFPKIENGVHRWVGALLKTVQDRVEREWVRNNLVILKKLLYRPRDTLI